MSHGINAQNSPLFLSQRIHIHVETAGKVSVTQLNNMQPKQQQKAAAEGKVTGTLSEHLIVDNPQPNCGAGGAGG